MNGRVILCEIGYPRPDEPSRCIVLGPVQRPDCDLRCGRYRTPDGYIEASNWADEMLETHDQKRCPGCGLWTVWVPSVAGDDLGRAGAS